MEIKKLLYFALIVTSSIPLRAMYTKEQLIQDNKSWLIANMTNQEFSIRIRDGIENNNTDRLILSQSWAKGYMINREAFQFPPHSFIIIDNIHTLKFPVRIRVWKEGYKPSEDIDEKGYPLETSEENFKNTSKAILFSNKDALRKAFPHMIFEMAPNGEIKFVEKLSSTPSKLDILTAEKYSE